MNFDISVATAMAANMGLSMSPDRLTVAGTALNTITGALNTSEANMLPDGVRNAMNSDTRYFLLEVAALARLSVTPESLETKSVTYRGTSYTVARPLVQGAQSTAKLICYRSPVEGASTQDGNTGLRKSFAPPEQP